MDRMSTGIHVRTAFPGVEEPYGMWYSVFHEWKGAPLKPISTISHCIGFRGCVFMVWSSKMAKVAFMKEPVFQVWKSCLDLPMASL